MCAVSAKIKSYPWKYGNPEKHLERINQLGINPEENLE